MITKETIIDAYLILKEKQCVSDETLDFMKNASIEKLIKNDKRNLGLEYINWPNWLKVEDVKEAIMLGNTKGKLHAVKKLHEAANGHIDKRLSWAKEFYESLFKK